jgi:hypothetical protein
MSVDAERVKPWHWTTSTAAASRPAVAIERVAEALLVEEETQRIVPAHELLRARPSPT